MWKYIHFCIDYLYSMMCFEICTKIEIRDMYTILYLGVDNFSSRLRCLFRPNLERKFKKRMSSDELSKDKYMYVSLSMFVVNLLF